MLNGSLRASSCACRGYPNVVPYSLLRYASGNQKHFFIGVTKLLHQLKLVCSKKDMKNFTKRKFSQLKGDDCYIVVQRVDENASLQNVSECGD